MAFFVFSFSFSWEAISAEFHLLPHKHSYLTQPGTLILLFGLVVVVFNLGINSAFFYFTDTFASKIQITKLAKVSCAEFLSAPQIWLFPYWRIARCLLASDKKASSKSTGSS